MTDTVSAAAISRILSREGFKRAPKGNHWAPGFEVQGLGPIVEVYVTCRSQDEQAKEVVEIVELINRREDKKYSAESKTKMSGVTVVEVVRREENRQEAEDTPGEIKDALDALREAVEAKDLSFMTRKAGDNSIFVYFLVPFTDKLRRMEVSWREGEYRSMGRFGRGSSLRVKTVEQMVAFAVNELAD